MKLEITITKHNKIMTLERILKLIVPFMVGFSPLKIFYPFTHNIEK